MNQKPTMYRIVVAFSGIPQHGGAQGASDRTEEFTRRAWHQNLSCTWDSSDLILYAESDYDEDGKALMDEFSDAISAWVAEPFDGDIVVRSITAAC